MRLFLYLGLGFLYCQITFAFNKAVDQELILFQKNPKAYMESQRPKWDQQGRLISTQESIFGKENLIGNRFVLLKSGSAYSKDFLNPFGPFVERTPSPIGPGDDPKKFVDRYVHEKLDSIEQNGLLSAKTKQTPWSDTYWPIAKGILSDRYADPKAPVSMDWKVNSDYVLTNLGLGEIHTLSPAEKYDLMMGDEKFTLTRRMLDEGRRYYDEYGSVEGWMGICHGWAPASYSVDRPEKSVTIPASDSTALITFTPSDIKALVSLLWANTPYANRQMGSRCNIKDPTTDENGRITDQNCFDDNPGSWHLAVVNQIGVSGRSFVMDATYDYQVWNQPVIGYRYSYFNPKTNKSVASLKDAAVILSDFKEDKFTKYRGPKAKSIVGIAMELTYAHESRASTRPHDSPQFDEQRTVRYLYDLEISEEGVIIGGEWYTNLHPDFLWGPAPSAQVTTIFDRWIDQYYPEIKWTGETSIPPEWKEASQMAATQALPLSHIVNTLVRLSKN